MAALLFESAKICQESKDMINAVGYCFDLSKSTIYTGLDLYKNFTA